MIYRAKASYQKSLPKQKNNNKHKKEHPKVKLSLLDFKINNNQTKNKVSKENKYRLEQRRTAPII